MSNIVFFILPLTTGLFSCCICVVQALLLCRGKLEPGIRGKDLRAEKIWFNLTACLAISDIALCFIPDYCDWDYLFPTLGILATLFLPAVILHVAVTERLVSYKQ